MRYLQAAILAACTSTSSATPPSVTSEHAPAATKKVSAAPIAKLGNAANSARVVAVQIVATVGDGAAREKPAYARADERVMLYAVVTTELSGRRTVYSDAPKLELRGKRVTAEPIAKAPVIDLRWNRIEPAANDMSNGATPADFHFHAIDYRATPIDGGSLRFNNSRTISTTLSASASFSRLS